MSIDFFKTVCKEPARHNNEFGLCDDQDNTKAYTDIADTDKWVAIVKNETRLPITFTPIDNCITVFKAGTKNKESTCDGMLTFTNSLYLVELKKQGTGGWISDAIGQLENTIKILYANHSLREFKYKKVYACNKKHPNFMTIDNELNKQFFKRTNGFRIDIQAEIKIK